MIEAVLSLTMLVVVIGVLGLSVGALLASAGARFLLTDTHPPAHRCRRVEHIALLPLLASLLAIGALVLPALFKLAGLIDDHCLEHGLHHPHFCLRHLPAFDVGPVAMLLMLASAWPISGLVRAVIGQAGQARLAISIARIAPARWRLITTDSSRPRAFLLGIRDPRVVLTAGLRRILSPAERRAVVRHEIAHARSGDLARRLVLGLLMPLHFPHTRRRLMQHWRQAAEERADDRVAARGKGLDLASALVKVLRNNTPAPAHGTYAMGADSADIARRIRRLVERPREPAVSPWLERFVFTGLAVFALGVATRHHHAAETFIGWVVQ